VPYHSQYAQDRWLNENIFKGQRHGVFVEFGALDGLLDSNSLFFESELEWRGLCIEANPAVQQRLVDNRPQSKRLFAAIYDRHGTVLFERIDGGLYGWSGIKDTIEPGHWKRIEKNIPTQMRTTVEVPCLPLKDALDTAGLKRIDYMSIDVEGAEFKILSVFPFKEYDVKVFGIEDNFGNPALDELLAKNGYAKISRVGPDNIYMKTSC
jgi:FkbM family methyltransferase